MTQPVDLTTYAEAPVAAEQAQPCRWCGHVDRPTRWDHDRMHRASESTWRQALWTGLHRAGAR